MPLLWSSLWGAVINAITKSGANTFNGSVFGFFQDNRLNADNRFTVLNNSTEPDSNRRQFGGTIGGPIKEDFAHFFFSYERSNIDRTVISTVPTRPDLNDTAITQTRSDNSTVRFDIQPSDSHQFSARWLREASPQLNQVIGNDLPSASREEADIDQTLVGSWSWTITSTLVNDLRANFTREDVTFANPGFNSGTSQADLMPTLEFASFTAQQNNIAQGRVNNSYRIADILVWVKDSHTIKVGGNFNYLEADNFNEGNLNGTFFFDTDNAFDPSNFATYPERFSIRVGGRSQFLQIGRYYGAFVQDSWKVSPNVTFNLGVRYDNESVSSDENNFSPRLGFAYDPGGNGKTVIRGGFGLFYQSTQFSILSAFDNNQPFATSFVRLFPLDDVDPGPTLIPAVAPTDPTLLSFPAVNRAAVDAIIGGNTLINNPNLTFDNTTRRQAFTRSFSFGVQRELIRDMALTIDYIHTNGIDQFITVDLNPAQRTTTVAGGTITRAFATIGGVIAASPYPLITAPFSAVALQNVSTNDPVTRINLGETTYDALQISLDKRFSQGFRFKTSYTLGRSEGNINGSLFAGANFQTQTGLNLDQQQGPTNFDRRHNFVASGVYQVPKTRGLLLSAVLMGLSGVPVTIRDGNFDGNQNGINFDPAPVGTFTNTRMFANGETITRTVENTGGVNGAVNPGFFQIDFRAAYKFNVSERINTGFTFELFNIANRTNFNAVDGRTNVGNFLIPTSAQTARRMQLGFRVAF